MITVGTEIIATSPGVVTYTDEEKSCGYVQQLSGKVIDIYRTRFTHTLIAVVKLSNGAIIRRPVSHIEE